MSPTPIVSFGRLGFMPCDVAVELGVDRLADRSHRRQREQLAAGERDIRRLFRQQHAADAKSAAVEFAQSQGIDDGCAALQRLILCRLRG